MNTDILTKELINFIEKLRFAGYNIGETQYIAAQDLILILAAQGKLPTELTELRQFLAPILCHSPKEQTEFETHFNQWVSQFAQTKIETETSPASELESELRTIKKGNSLWKWAFIAFAMIFLSSIFVYWSDISDLLKSDEIAQPIQPDTDEITQPIQPDSGEVVHPKSTLPSTEIAYEKNYHTVQAGETLSGIAKKYDQNYQKIAAWNNLDNPDSISIGQRLLVSPPNEKSSSEEIQAVTPSLLVSPSNEKSSPDEIRPATPSLWDRLPSLQVWFTLLSPLLVLLLWQLWWRYRAQLFLARQSTTTLPDIRQLFLKHTEDKFFKTKGLARTAQQLRKHISMPANVLDIAATIEKTTQSGGWFTPITGTIKTRPEYLALIDRTTFNDHQTQLINSLINQLVADDVLVTRYYFDTVPRRCYPEQSQQAPLTLTELAQHYPEHRLLVFSDGNGLINPITCQVVNWIEQFSVWTQRALFTLETPEEWGYREQLLDEANFLILPANEAGFKGMVERINTGTWQPYPRPSDSDSNPFPEYLQERPRRWLEHHAPDTPVLTALLKQVRDFLGDEGYSWFSACAVYPELRWQLTLYLGEQMKSLTEERLAKLARLPWFRYGYMPDWLRMQLIKDLSLPQEHKIRTALYNRLLETSDKPLSDFGLEIAKTQQNTLSAFAQRLLPKWAKKAPKNSPLHDSVFMTFMGDKLAVKIPKILRNLFAQPEEVPTSLSEESHHEAKLPNLLSLLWLILMQPITLRHRLKACGIENPDASIFKLWFAQDEIRSIKRQYVKQFLLLLLVVMPMISMGVIYLYLALFDSFMLLDNRVQNWVLIIIAGIISGMVGSMRGYMSSFLATSMAIGVGIAMANAIYGINSDVVGVAIAGIFLSAAVAEETNRLARIVAISLIFGVGFAIALGVLTAMGDVSVIIDVTYIMGGVLGDLANGMIGGVLYGLLIGLTIFIGFVMLQKIAVTKNAAIILAGGIATPIVLIIIWVSVIFYAGEGNPPVEDWWYKVLWGIFMLIIGYLRLPIYIIEVVWQMICYTIQKTTKRSTLRFVPVLYHNLSFFPHPFLAQHIILGLETEPKLAKKVLDACAFLPGQYHVGQAVLTWLRENEHESKNEDESKLLYNSNPSMFRNRPYLFIFSFLSIIVAVVAEVGIYIVFGEEYDSSILFLSLILIIMGSIGLLVLTILWLKVINMRLIVTTESVTLNSGILSKNIREVFLSDIKSVQIKQSFSQREMGTGDLKVVSTKSSNAEIAIDGIPRVYGVKTIIDKYRRDQASVG